MRVCMIFSVALLVAVSCTGCGAKRGDQGLAERAMLRSSDLPGGVGRGGLGWHVDKSGGQTVIGRCANFELPGVGVTGRDHSDWFYSPASLERDWQVTSFSGVYEQSADRTGVLEDLGDQAAQCIRVDRASDTDYAGRPVEAKVREIPFPRIGGGSRAYEIKSGIGTLKATHEYVVLIRTGRALSLLYVVSASSASHDHLMVKFAESDRVAEKDDGRCTSPPQHRSQSSSS